MSLLYFLLHYLQEYSKIWNIAKSNKSELWNHLSYRGLPYLFEVRSLITNSKSNNKEFWKNIFNFIFSNLPSDISQNNKNNKNDVNRSKMIANCCGLTCQREGWPEGGLTRGRVDQRVGWPEEGLTRGWVDQREGWPVRGLASVGLREGWPVLVWERVDLWSCSRIEQK